MLQRGSKKNNWRPVPQSPRRPGRAEIPHTTPWPGWRDKASHRGNPCLELDRARISTLPPRRRCRRQTHSPLWFLRRDVACQLLADWPNCTARPDLPVPDTLLRGFSHVAALNGGESAMSAQPDNLLFPLYSDIESIGSIYFAPPALGRVGKDKRARSPGVRERVSPNRTRQISPRRWPLLDVDKQRGTRYTIGAHT